MIEIQAVSKRYENGFLALDNINLNIPRGEIFGVLGKSGAGKSTLLRCINLLERPTSGQILVDGIDLTKLSAAKLREQRHNIGIIFQHYNLLQSCNVFENIALPLKILQCNQHDIQKKVSALLKLVHLEDKAHYHPSQLSGGQKQRVGIARALAADPKVLLCDEATSALDTESTASILRLLKKINRELNLTIFMITHELEVVKQICDKVAVINEGRLVEQNTTVNIFSNPKHEVTKQVIQQALHFYKPNSHDSQSLFLKFTFIGHDSEEPLISNLIKQFDVSINIKQALIEKIQETTVGFTICELKGTEEAIKAALNYVKSTSVKVEVIHA